VVRDGWAFTPTVAVWPVRPVRSAVVATDGTLAAPRRRLTPATNGTSRRTARPAVEALTAPAAMGVRKFKVFLQWSVAKAKPLACPYLTTYCDADHRDTPI